MFHHPFSHWNTSFPIQRVLFQSIILNQSINFYVLILFSFPFWLDSWNRMHKVNGDVRKAGRGKKSREDDVKGQRCDRFLKLSPFGGNDLLLERRLTKGNLLEPRESFFPSSAPWPMVISRILVMLFLIIVINCSCEVSGMAGGWSLLLICKAVGCTECVPVTSRDQPPLSLVGTGTTTAVLTGLLWPVTPGVPAHMFLVRARLPSEGTSPSRARLGLGHRCG